MERRFARLRSSHSMAAAFAALLLVCLPLAGCKLLLPDRLCEKVREPVPFEILTPPCRINIASVEPQEEKLSAVELVITNQADFDGYITCTRNVEIDFEEHFVLAGMTRLHGTWFIIENQEVYFSCDTLVYSIELRDGAATIPWRETYVAAIPIAYRGYPVKFDVF